MNRDGKGLGAVGRGMGIGEGEFIEASYWSSTSRTTSTSGDTSVSRITR
jgi:hypothetical protein